MFYAFNSYRARLISRACLGSVTQSVSLSALISEPHVHSTIHIVDSNCPSCNHISPRVNVLKTRGKAYIAKSSELQVIN